MSLEDIFNEKLFKEQSKELKKMLRRLRQIVYLYSNDNLEVQQLQRINIIDLTRQLDELELDKKIPMETYFKSGLSQLHSSITNKKEIQQTMLSKFFKKDNKYYRDIQKQPKQIDIIDLIQIDFEDSPLQL